jgi:hypothetical protein
VIGYKASGAGIIGQMDEVAIFKRALSAAQIEALFDGGKAGQTVNVIIPDILEPEACGDAGTVYLDNDYNQDCYVDFADLGLFVLEWLNCTDPSNAACDSYWK